MKMMGKIGEDDGKEFIFYAVNFEAFRRLPVRVRRS